MPPKRRIVRQIAKKMDADKSYCRRCQNVKSIKEFLDATDRLLDGNGHMSICRDCVTDLYVQFYNSTRSVEHAILKLCQLLNVRYDKAAIDAALSHIDSAGTNADKMFGLYKTKLLLLNRTSVRDGTDTIDLTYNHPLTLTISAPKEVEETSDIDASLKAFWGENFTKAELEILERKFADWSRSHSIDTQSERVLLKYICLKEFEIDNAISSKQGTASLMKEFQELLKTSALSPSMANAASGGKSMEAFGNFIKEIESMTPAEWVKDKSIYKDVDNIEEYGEKYITSPLRSFVTGSREFSLEDDSEKDDSNNTVLED